MSRERADPFGNYLLDRMHYKAGAYYRVTFEAGKRKWQKIGTEYHVAIREWARLEGDGQAQTVAQAIEGYLGEKRTDLAPETLRGYENCAKRINPIFGATYLDEVETIHVRKWMHSREHLTAANRDLAFLRTVYNHAIEMGWCRENPASIRQRRVKPRRRTASTEELAKLSAVSPPIWRALIATYILTGARVSELRTLKRSQLTDEGIELDRTKVDKQSLIVWTPELKATIETALKAPRVGSLYVFPSRKGGPYTADGMTTMWRRYCDRAGIEGLQMRDLRRTAASVAESLEHASALLGHTSTTITARVYRVRDKVRPTR